MIFQADSPTRIKQFNKLLTKLMRKNRTLDGQLSPIIQKRQHLAHPAEMALYRNRRTRFFQRVAFAWKNRDASADASMAALSTLLSPWTRWSGGTITLSNYQAWLVYFERIFELWTYGIFDPVTIAAGNVPWPTNWPTPIDWDTVSIDFFASPPRVTIHHPTPVPSGRNPLLAVYLAAPNKRFTLNPLKTSMLVWTQNTSHISHTSTQDVYDLPTEKNIYPYNLPPGPTPCAIRPIDGAASIGTPPKTTLLPMNNFVYRFVLPRPGA